MSRRWYPLLTDSKFKIEAGQLVALRHGVWRVTDVAEGKVGVEHVAGALPDWAAGMDGPITGTMQPPESHMWHIYRSERWPACSCCGEPMPCRAEIEEREVGAALTSIAAAEAKVPGCCWACQEPITARQTAVQYDGDNLELPGAPPPVFHVRRACRHAAERYELRWLAQDPRRERILTYPKCGGRLIVHADGSSECIASRSPIGSGTHESQPGCDGHLTHDHGFVSACYVGDNMLRNPNTYESQCPRGCPKQGHPGARATRRPKVRPRDPSQLNPT